MSSSKPRDVGKGVKSEGNSAVANTQIRTDVLFNPDTASCEGNSTICLVFDETAESLISGSSRVEICVRTSEKSDRLAATQVNERTFSFLAPANREGDATAVVFVDETEVASTYLRYRSDTVHLVAGVSQIYLQFLSTVCRYMYTLQTKHQIPSPIPELDRLLAETFEDKDNKYNIPPVAFEELFDILRHSSADVVESKYEFPTLLHLTGEYGLEQLAAKLLDLPGATRASNVLNHNKRTATELARNNGHSEVAKTLRASNKPKSIQVESRDPTLKHTRGPAAFTLMPNSPPSGPKPKVDNDYMLPDSATRPEDFEDNYFILPQQQQPSNIGGSSGASRKPPPAPCPKFTQSKSVPSVMFESQAEFSARLPPRSSGTGAPPVPQRVSRDSGVNVDSMDAPGPLPTPPRKRPPLTKGDTEPVYVYNEEGHFVPGRRTSQETAGKTVQRNATLSGEEIARQLKRPVHAEPGHRGPSVTK